ncbi:Hypothetical predicted protein [Marmota monax]|uniref:Uncharacterized protein n=1 Tax=Marmota monax TaxID=9995 RepID=A0A5E4BI86_MARMO|nr:Hypothetical predicted protein [Marmota monax]
MQEARRLVGEAQKLRDRRQSDFSSPEALPGCFCQSGKAVPELGNPAREEIPGRPECKNVEQASMNFFAGADCKACRTEVRWVFPLLDFLIESLPPPWERFVGIFWVEIEYV